MVATLLTLVFLPALYVARFRIQPAQSTSASSNSDLDAHSRATKIVRQLEQKAALSEPVVNVP